MSYAGLGSAASYKRYWSNYAKACQGMADEGACLNRAVQHGANVTFSASGLGQAAAPPGVPASMADTQRALQIAASLAQIGAQVISNPDLFTRTQAPRVVNALDESVVTPLVDRVAQRAAPYFIRYVMPPLAVLYVLSGMAAFFSYEVLKGQRGRVSANRRRRH
jgi:hypothetical protein